MSKDYTNVAGVAAVTDGSLVLAQHDHGEPVEPEHPDRVVYAYYLRPTRPLVRATSAVAPPLILALFFAFVLLGPSPTSAIAVLAAVGVIGTLRLYVEQPAAEIGVALTETHVIIGRGPSDTRTIERSRIISCVRSDRTWRGEEPPAAAASWLIKRLPYLTITCDDGVAYNVAFDSANMYADHIYDVLRGSVDLLTPTALASQARSATTTREPAESSTADDSVDGETSAPETAAEADRRASSAATLDAEHRLWTAATQRHDEILLAYFPYESSPQLLLAYPTMSDVTVPETGDFVEALGDATALRTDAFPQSLVIAQAYRDAVKTLATAWANAERSAKRLGTSLLDGPDRKRLDQAAKLLAHADSATSSHERAAYLRQVKTIVDDLVRSGAITAPPKVMMQIERLTARAIEAARTA